LRLFSFGGYGLALAALALVVLGAIECPPIILSVWQDEHTTINQHFVDETSGATGERSPGQLTLT